LSLPHGHTGVEFVRGGSGLYLFRTAWRLSDKLSGMRMFNPQYWTFSGTFERMSAGASVLIHLGNAAMAKWMDWKANSAQSALTKCTFLHAGQSRPKGHQ
jgi:hypothetical protein